MLTRLRAALRAGEYALGRILGRRWMPLAEVAFRSEILVPGGSVRAVRPFFVPEHLERIEGARTYGRERVIAEDLNRSVFEFRPVVAHWVRDVCLLGGSIYAPRHRHELRSIYANRGIGMNLAGDASAFDFAVLGSTCAGSSWWGHWLEDEVPLQLLAARLGPLVGHRREPYAHERHYRELLALPPIHLADVARFSRLVLVDEFAQNPDKTRRYRKLRARLKELPRGRRRVYLRRGDSGARRLLVNEPQVLDRLARAGFEIVDVTRHSASRIVAECRGAELLVSVEGSHMAPLLYLAEDFGTLVILNPPAQVHTTVADIAGFCGLSAAMFVCERAPSGEPDEFHADPDELVRYIDRALEHGEAHRPRLREFLQEVEALAPPEDVHRVGEELTP